MRGARVTSAESVSTSRITLLVFLLSYVDAAPAKENVPLPKATPVRPVEFGTTVKSAKRGLTVASKPCTLVVQRSNKKPTQVKGVDRATGQNLHVKISLRACTRRPIHVAQSTFLAIRKKFRSWVGVGCYLSMSEILSNRTIDAYRRKVIASLYLFPYFDGGNKNVHHRHLVVRDTLSLVSIASLSSLPMGKGFNLHNGLYIFIACCRTSGKGVPSKLSQNWKARGIQVPPVPRASSSLDSRWVKSKYQDRSRFG